MVESKTAPIVGQMPDFTQQPVDVLNARVQDLLGNRFVQKCGQTEREREETSLTESATCDSFADCQYVGLFFSADWCPPCKTMLQPLKNFYTDVNLQTRTFEIVLVSSDRSQEEWKRHHSTMPWMSLPFDDPKAHELREKFEIYGVPALIILEARTGFTVTTNARKDLKKNVTEVYESWRKLLELKKVRAVERAS